MLQPTDMCMRSVAQKDGFATRWNRTGTILAGNSRALEHYMRQTWRYGSVAMLLSMFGMFEESIHTPKTMLDVTAMNGVITRHILNKAKSEAKGGVTVYANEISKKMRKNMAKTLAEYILSEGPVKCVPVSVDVSDAKSTESLRNLDVVLWYCSFQLGRGRLRAIENAFDMLRDGGHLVIMDAYPFDNEMLGRYFGEKRATEIVWGSRTLDMGEDVKHLISSQWTLKWARAAGAGRLERPRILESSALLSESPFTEMRGLCFTKQPSANRDKQEL